MGIVLSLIQVVLTVYGYVLIATAVLSWVPDLAQTRLGLFLYKVTEPYLGLFRRYIPPLRIGGVGIDISFIVAVIVYFFLQAGILSVLSAIVR
ncbi:YggT family protein [Alicyclobacillus sp. ALC3]|uniref:YggT family protein n=1 Tax=Alicyclobacillus sp. ALC3 TaxID=2796143 RepID=UPI002378F4CE|nr:YggT family protein [Alicyclobacillus sp. ALC3]WDL97433.1 YggT family protein [Alicyclobacillus sp. ALC3]